MKARINKKQCQRPEFESRTNGVVGWAVVVCCGMLWTYQAVAYPPAPHHVVFGLVRDEFGTPILTSQVQVVLETPDGVQIAAPLTPSLAPDVNFEMDVPMDAGVTADLYEPNALLPSAAFKMYVVVGQVTNMPIQMVGNFALLGQPGKRTRIDLTLGIDSNGDGIPDAWEMAYLAAIGSNLSLANVNAASLLGPDGLTLLQEYLAGYYPFDPADTFLLKMVDVNGGSPLLQFTAITGRSYTLLGSADLNSWTPLSFLVPSEGPNGPTHSVFVAPSVQTIQLQALQPAAGAPMHYFRLLLQ